MEYLRKGWPTDSTKQGAMYTFGHRDWSNMPGASNGPTMAPEYVAWVLAWCLWETINWMMQISNSFDCSWETFLSIVQPWCKGFQLNLLYLVLSCLRVVCWNGGWGVWAIEEVWEFGSKGRKNYGYNILYSLRKIIFNENFLKNLSFFGKNELKGSNKPVL